MLNNGFLCVRPPLTSLQGSAQSRVRAGNMCAGSQRKGKYAPVRMLASRMGATWLLRLQPSLVGDMLQAMRFESVCPANAGLLEAVLGSLRHECMESAGPWPCLGPCSAMRS